VPNYKIITITHHTAPLAQLKSYIPELEANEEYPYKKLKSLMQQFHFEELYYVNTCNRILFLFIPQSEFTIQNVKKFIQKLNPLKKDYNEKEVKFHENAEAVKHLFSVASSLDSLVLGEREIIGQLRTANEKCMSELLSGEKINLLIQNAIGFAKTIHTQTKISERPVSVVSLAYRHLSKAINLDNKKVIFIGAGQSNALFINLLSKHSLSDVAIFNRSLSKATQLAEKFPFGKSFPLKDLGHLPFVPDVVICCTSSQDEIITEQLLTQWNLPKGRTIFVDLAIPYDINKAAVKRIGCPLIEIGTLKLEAEKNIAARNMEIQKAALFMDDGINDFIEKYNTRKIEVALSSIPQKMQAIRQRAVENIFIDKIQEMDSNAQKILSEILDYIDEKYIALPYKEAKKSLLHLELNEKI
jgi:glutamyl-tRNA reductase